MQRYPHKALVVLRTLAVPAGVVVVSALLAQLGLLEHFWFTFFFVVAIAFILSRWVSMTRVAFTPYAPHESDSELARKIGRRVLIVFFLPMFLMLALLCAVVVLWSTWASQTNKEIVFAMFVIPFVVLHYLQFGLVYLCFYIWGETTVDMHQRDKK